MYTCMYACMHVSLRTETKLQFLRFHKQAAGMALANSPKTAACIQRGMHKSEPDSEVSSYVAKGMKPSGPFS